MRPRTGKPPFAIVDAPPVTPPAPPRALGPTGQDLWARVQAEFVISDVGGVELLCQCCEAADMVQELSECVAREDARMEHRLEEFGKDVGKVIGMKARSVRDQLEDGAFC
jgi:hypothetical protein